MRLLIPAFILAIITLFLPADSLALSPTDDVLAAKYRQLQQDIKPEEALSRHKELMQTSKYYLELTNEALAAMTALEEHADTVISTGLMFEHSFKEIEKFKGSLERINSNPALKGFDSFMSKIGSVDDAVAFTSQFTATLNNKDLPDNARNTLLALQAVGTMFQKLGNVPILGAALEGYGQVIGGLASKINGLSKNITATKKYSFENHEDHLIQGLDLRFHYLKTPVWQYGLPVVEKLGSAGEFFLQKSDGSWEKLNHSGYKQVTSIITDYQLTYRKPIDNRSLWKYLKDKDLRGVLRTSADFEIEKKRIEDTLGHLESYDPGPSRIVKFESIENKIIKLHQQYHLPLTYSLLSKYIRVEYQRPGIVEKDVRKRIMDTYPQFREYLEYIEFKENVSTSDQIPKLFKTYLKGEHLVSDFEVFIKDSETDQTLDNAMVEIRGPIGTMKVRAINGRVFVENLPPGKYNIRILAKGYEKRGDKLILEPMTHKRGQVTLKKIVEEKPPKPEPVKKEEYEPQAKPEPTVEYVPQTPIDLPVPPQPEPEKPNENEACVKKWNEIADRAHASNASNDPSGNMGTVMLGAPECQEQYNKCQDEGIKAGNECRRQPHPGLDPVAVNKKCNTIVGTKWIECAQQEVDCSLPYLLKQCQK